MRATDKEMDVGIRSVTGFPDKVACTCTDFVLAVTGCLHHVRLGQTLDDSWMSALAIVALELYFVHIWKIYYTNIAKYYVSCVIKMKKTIVILAVLMLSFPAAWAACPPELKYDASAALAGGYNPAWGGYAGIDLAARMGVGSHLDIRADVEGLTANVWSFGITARPKVALGPGELFLDATIFCRLPARNRMFDFVTSESLGWKMKNLDCQFGLFSRTTGSLDRKMHTPDEFENEPFNFLYRVQFNVFGDQAKWDIFGGFTDFTPYEYERMWSPIFFIGGRYGINDRLGIRAEADIKPTGMFHLTALSYGIVGRVAVTYSF